MLQLLITSLLAFAGLASCVVIAQTLRRAWKAAGELRAAIARCDDTQTVTLRTSSIERRPALRVIRGAKDSRPAPVRCALPVAA